MTFKRVVLTTLAVLCAVAAAAPARAASRTSHRHRLLGAVTLTREAGGTLIRINDESRQRVHLLRSRDPLAALAVADVDNDGDLDILAAREGGGLILWRNNGGGGFIVALAPGRADVTRRQTDIRTVLLCSAPLQSGDDRFDAALPRAPDAAADSIDTPHFARPSSLLLSGSAVCHPGRAPPAFA